MCLCWSDKRNLYSLLLRVNLYRAVYDDHMDFSPVLDFR